VRIGPVINRPRRSHSPRTQKQNLCTTSSLTIITKIISTGPRIPQVHGLGRQRGVVSTQRRHLGSRMLQRAPNAARVTGAELHLCRLSASHIELHKPGIPDVAATFSETIARDHVSHDDPRLQPTHRTSRTSRRVGVRRPAASSGQPKPRTSPRSGEGARRLERHGRGKYRERFATKALKAPVVRFEFTKGGPIKRPRQRATSRKAAFGVSARRNNRLVQKDLAALSRRAHPIVSSRTSRSGRSTRSGAGPNE